MFHQTCAHDDLRQRMHGVRLGGSTQTIPLFAESLNARPVVDAQQSPHASLRHGAATMQKHDKAVTGLNSQAISSLQSALSRPQAKQQSCHETDVHCSQTARV